MKHTPATPLPWKAGVSSPEGADGNDVFFLDGCQDDLYLFSDSRDRAYIAHAANAYPRLVQALRAMVKAEEEYGDPDNAAINEAWGPANDLLKELGE